MRSIRFQTVALGLGLLAAAGSFLNLAAPLASAQAGLGGLNGLVTDPTGAIVGGAQVTLTNPGTGYRETTVSTGAGEYRFTALEVTSGYVLRVSAAGFKTAEIKGISTSVGVVLAVNVKLQLGDAVQTVEVTSSENVEQVQTDTAAISELIDSQVWENSPLEDRTQNAFVNLTAGATPDSGTGRGSAVDGSRTGTGNFLVDGMDNNDQGLGGGNAVGGGGAVTTISPDAIQEYRVISHNVPAEYGRAGGFATDTVLKSGTNKWHGSAFEYNRIQALAADDFFSKQAGILDHLVRNQFGGSVGGHLYKDKTYFYATVEIHHKRQSNPETGTVATQAFLNFVTSGNFEKFQEGTYANTGVTDNTGAVQLGLCQAYFGFNCPGALTSASKLGPIFQKLLAAEPTAFPLGTANASNDAQGFYTAGLLYPVPVYATTTVPIFDALNQNRGSLKLDHKLTDKDQLSFAYLVDLYNDTNSDEAGTSSFGPPGNNIGGAQNFSATWTHTFSPSLLNLFRAGYLRHVSNFVEPGTSGVPEIYAADPLYSGFGAADNIPQLFTENEFLYEDSLTKNLRNHAFKGGFRFIRTRNGSSFFADENGTLGVWDVENLLTDAQLNDQFENYANANSATTGGYPYGQAYGSLYSASAAWDTVDNTLPNFYRGYRANELSAYLQDDWKVNKRLSLNLGVRWDYFGPPHNFQPGYDSNVYFGTFATPNPTGNPFLPQTPLAGAEQGATFIQKNSNIWNKDTTAIGPHIGFAYDVTGSGKFAIRGGYTIAYDRLYNNVYENIRFNYPKYSDSAIGYGTAVAAGALYQPGLYEVPFTGNSLFAKFGALPVPRHVDERLKDAYYEQLNFGYEYQLHAGYVWEANYVGTLGRQLVGLDNINTFPGRTACPPGTYSATSACGAAGYKTGFSTSHLNTGFNNDNFRTNGFNSNYHGFQTSMRKGYSNGLQFIANYTFAKVLDEISDVFTIRTALTGTTNSFNKAYDYGPADFDTKHNVSVTMNYQEQWKKKNLLLGGWGISPIVFLRSGTPFTPYDSSGSYNPIKDGRTGDRAVYAGNGSVKNAITHAHSPALAYLTPGSFKDYTCPAGSLWCNPPVQRNVITGPAYKDLDLGVLKRFPVTEATGFTLGGNFFNLFNHTNFNNPVNNISNSQFGVSQGDVGPRVTQLSLRYDF